jgi:hypothetical protein
MERPIQVKKQPKVERLQFALFDAMIEANIERAEKVILRVKRERGDVRPDGDPRDLGLGADSAD